VQRNFVVYGDRLPGHEEAILLPSLTSNPRISG